MKNTAFMLSLLLAWSAKAADSETAPLPPFDELRKIVLSNLDGVEQGAVDAAAGAALLEAFGNRLSVVGEEKPNEELKLIHRSELMANGVGYVAMEHLEEGAATAFDKLVESWQGEGGLKGLVLDLRFTRGFDYEEAVSLANRFLQDSKPLLFLGKAGLRSTLKGEALKVPAVILVNGETAGAPEALASLLRHHHQGVVVGSPTAGAAHYYRIIKTSTGLKLRVANGSIRLAEGPTLTLDGIQPDLRVAAALEHEMQWRDNPRLVLEPVLFEEDRSGPLSAPRSERELVRRHNGGNSGTPDDAEDKEGKARVADDIQDPVLMRGLDLLKAFSIVSPRR